MTLAEQIVTYVFVIYCIDPGCSDQFQIISVTSTIEKANRLIEDLIHDNDDPDVEYDYVKRAVE